MMNYHNDKDLCNSFERFDDENDYFCSSHSKKIYGALIYNIIHHSPFK
jgi:hypothetical protein